MTNEELCALIAEGNEEAKELLFKQNTPFLWSLATKYRNVDVPDEIFGLAQLGFVKAMNLYDPSKGSLFITYASWIMNNEILYHYRRNKRHKIVDSFEDAILSDGDGNLLRIEDTLVSDDATPEEVIVDSEKFDVLYELVDKLVTKPKHKEIVKLYATGKTTRKVAEILGYSQSYSCRVVNKFIRDAKNYVGVKEIKKETLPLTLENIEILKAQGMKVKDIIRHYSLTSNQYGYILKKLKREAEELVKV